MAERFLTLEQICERAGYTPKTVRTYRARSMSHKLKLPELMKRGDGRLGCLESTLDKYLQDTYGRGA
jgi:hypothetical protein